MSFRITWGCQGTAIPLALLRPSPRRRRPVRHTFPPASGRAMGEPDSDDRSHHRGHIPLPVTATARRVQDAVAYDSADVRTDPCSRRGMELLNTPLTNRSKRLGRVADESGTSALSEGSAGPMSRLSPGRQRPPFLSRQENLPIDRLGQPSLP